MEQTTLDGIFSPWQHLASMLRQKQLRQLIAVQRLVRHMATQRRLLVGQAGNGIQANLVKTLNTGNPMVAKSQRSKAVSCSWGRAALLAKASRKCFLANSWVFKMHLNGEVLPTSQNTWTKIIASAW